jgi:hypothetical protein
MPCHRLLKVIQNSRPWNKEDVNLACEIQSAHDFKEPEGNAKQ